MAVPLDAKLPESNGLPLAVQGICEPGAWGHVSMTFIVATLLGVLAILAAAIAGLLVQLRALRKSEELQRADTSSSGRRD